MMLGPGDRVRYECTGDDGLPLVRYGFVGGVGGSQGPVIVLLDGELNGELVDIDDVQPVTVLTVELILHGIDLLDEPELRRGLVSLWHAEADTAGLDIDALHPLGDGECSEPGKWCLAELHAGDERYLLRALRCDREPETVRVRAELP